MFGLVGSAPLGITIMLFTHSQLKRVQMGAQLTPETKLEECIFLHYLVLTSSEVSKVKL